MEKLQGILADRTKYYENADIVIDISAKSEESENGAPTAAVMYRTMVELNNRIESAKKNREERMNFQIKYAQDAAKNVENINSISPDDQQQQEKPPQ